MDSVLQKPEKQNPEVYKCTILHLPAGPPVQIYLELPSICIGHSSLQSNNWAHCNIELYTDIAYVYIIYAELSVTVVQHVVRILCELYYSEAAKVHIIGYLEAFNCIGLQLNVSAASIWFKIWGVVDPGKNNRFSMNIL